MKVSIEEINRWFLDLVSSDKYYIYGLYHDEEDEENDMNFDEGEETQECEVERCKWCGEFPENCRCEEVKKSKVQT